MTRTLGYNLEGLLAQGREEFATLGAEDVERAVLPRQLAMLARTGLVLRRRAVLIMEPALQAAAGS